MATSTTGAHCWTLDWESIAALCPDEWSLFAKECVRIIGCDCIMREYSANDWLHPICDFLQWGQSDGTFDQYAEGETYEGMGQRIMELWGAVAAKFEEKTRTRDWLGRQKDGLTLWPHAKTSEGEREDDIQPGQHYFELGGTHVVSPAFTKFKTDYPAARPQEQTWTEWG